jgi:hypothetical protein
MACRSGPASGRRARRWVVAVAAAVGGYGWLQRLGPTYGATVAERRQPLPGDGLVRRPRMRTTHGITTDVPPGRVWPWLVQMGWGRGQWYTARWVDRLLFPANPPSADRIRPELQTQCVGDRILDGPRRPAARSWLPTWPQTTISCCTLASTSRRVGPDALVPSSTSRGRSCCVTSATAAPVSCSVPGPRPCPPWWVGAFYRLVIVPADFVVSRQMLRGVKSRAERTPLTPAAAAPTNVDPPAVPAPAATASGAAP